MFNNRCSGYNSWNHLILLYALVIKKSHLAPLGPGYVSSSKGQNDLMQFLDQKGWCFLYVMGCGRGVLTEQDRCWHKTGFASNGLRYISDPETCPHSWPWRICTLLRRLTLSTLCISHTGQRQHLRKAKVGWPATLGELGRIPELYAYSPKREQINRNDPTLWEQASQMSLD